MLIQAINELNVTLRLLTVSPLIVTESRVDRTKPFRLPISRASQQEVHDALADAAVMDNWGDKFYIPGSSMRGAWRSHLERILRSANTPPDIRVCDPLAEAGDFQGCGHALLRQRDPYRRSCPICKLFGSTVQGSRLAIGDGKRMPAQGGGYTGNVVGRDHVRIDRRLGRVAPNAAPLRFYGLQGAWFEVQLRLRNFELDQLVILKTLLDEIQKEQIQLGSGKSKGYGRVRGQAFRADLTCFGTVAPDTKLLGIAESREWRDEECRKYGFRKYDALFDLPAGQWTRESGWRFTRTFVNPPLGQFLVAIEQLRPQWESRWGTRVEPLSRRIEKEAQV